MEGGYLPSEGLFYAKERQDKRAPYTGCFQSVVFWQDSFYFVCTA
jgi:hypothetical protein